MTTLLSDLPESISLSRIKELVDAYPKQAPAAHSDLDEARLKSIPTKIQERNPASLSKEEVVILLKWKLSHGKFRPNLMKLVLENSSATVETTTADAFKLYGSGSCEHVKVLQQVLQKLSELRGVGPATASLLLSVYDSQNVPFFSDELFRYLLLTAGADGDVQGWDRKIKYNMKEYLDLYERAARLKARLNDGIGSHEESITALDIGKGAYVSGKMHGSAVAPVKFRNRTTGKRKLDDDDEARPRKQTSRRERDA